MRNLSMKKSIHGYIQELKDAAFLYEIKASRLAELEKRLNRAVGLINEELTSSYQYGSMTDEDLRKFRWLRSIKDMLDPDK